jgi:NADH-quinone oxidoreductase subunit L
MPNFQDRPGFFFVAATLLPLLSFVVLLLAGGVRWLGRRYRNTAQGEALYNLCGGDKPSRVPAYVALGAIALAFVLSFIGFVIYVTGHASYEKEHEEREAAILALQRQEHDLPPGDAKAAEEHEHKLHAAHAELLRLEERWSGHFDWLHLSPSGLNDPGRATTLQIGFYIDGLSALMFVMVTFVASLIHLFSIGYMSEEEEETVTDHHVHTEHGHLHRRGRFGRFFLYLSLFCFSMLNLILADNLFQVFVSWELVGICSYLLIGFYFERPTASNAANKAFITNRVGDAGFVFGLLILWAYLGTFNFQDIFHQVRAPMTDSEGTRLAVAGKIVRGNVQPPPENASAIDRQYPYFVQDPDGSAALLFPRDELAHFHGLGSKVRVSDSPKPDDFGYIPYWMLVAAGLGIFLGCVGKSAQFPLHVWLPDAMEGPTPVSALIHAATMVAAGVYLVGRVFPLFTPEARLVIAYTGGITLFMAATIAIVMTDIKKVLAYSTVSQLGYMMLALGVGGWVAGLFHLITHAFFKALLFLGSGSVIYGCHHEQDMEKMGGLYPKMKITALTMLMGVLAIAGIPFFTGWYSKDSILAHAFGFAYVHPGHVLLFLLPLVTAGITTFYMFRMWFLTFTGTPRDHHVHEHAHESPWMMTTPLVILAVLSVCVAWGWPIWDAEASWMEHHLHHAQPKAVIADFGHVLEHDSPWEGGPVKDVDQSERAVAAHYHFRVGLLVLGMVALGIVFAVLLYYKRVLDPAEAQAQFPGLHAFLWNKWYFDELYSVLLVRPALVVAHWFKRFDLGVIDGIIHGVARSTVNLSRWDGRFDNGIVDGLVNLVGRVVYAIGAWTRGLQTGYLRSYVLFLVLAAVGIFIALSYFVALAAAG